MLPASLLTDPLNPNRPANWRWERARWLREKSRYVRKGYDDDYVQMARRFQCDQAKCRFDADFERLARRYPGIFWAHDIYNRQNDTRWLIEASLLAGMPLSQLAEFCKTDIPTVIWYESLFFDVLKHLHNEMWIVSVVMGSAVHFGLQEREYDLLWKMVGYGLGPLYLRAFVFSFRGVRVTEIDQVDASTDAWIDRQTRKKTAIGIQTMPVYHNQAVIFEAWSRARELELTRTGAGGGAAVIIQNIQAAMSALPFTAGRRDSDLIPQLAAHDSDAAEMRASEQMQMLVSGQDFKSLAEWKFPDVAATAPVAEPVAS